MVEHFYSAKQRLIIYISFSGDTFVFVNGTSSHFNFIVEKQHFNNLSVGRISVHNLGISVTFAEPYLIITI